MLGADIAQYGIATFAVAGLVYIVGQFLKQRNDQTLMSVIENNTKALEQVAGAIQTMQVSQARQEAKLDELLERARR
jgi:hypothetical protein